jgi:hypothetical protein
MKSRWGVGIPLGLMSRAKQIQFLQRELLFLQKFAKLIIIIKLCQN